MTTAIEFYQHRHVKKSWISKFTKEEGEDVDLEPKVENNKIQGMLTCLI